MNCGSLSRIPAVCPLNECLSQKANPVPPVQNLKNSRIVRKGFYYRSSDSRWIARFFCQKCMRTFSHATGSECFGQKKRKLNLPIDRLYCAGMTQRGIAKYLGISRTTVVRKFLFLALQAREEHFKYLKMKTSRALITQVQFDEMESFERSKCLPVSILLMVEESSRKILGFRVCEMPAKGPLAEISRKKYGFRADRRTPSANELFTELKPYLSSFVEIKSDQNPRYPNWIRPHFPKATLRNYKGRRGCVVGQGELKRGGFDPLFSLNHTAAMIRAHLSRLMRRTWTTTKKRERLTAHLWIYLREHNQVLT